MKSTMKTFIFAYILLILLPLAEARDANLKRLEKTFQILIKSDHPQKRINDFLLRQRSIYFRASNLVINFDRELAEKQDNILESQTYKKLLFFAYHQRKYSGKTGVYLCTIAGNERYKKSPRTCNIP